MPAPGTTGRAQRRIATRNGQPAYLSPAQRQTAPVTMADWRDRPRPHPLRALLSRLIGRPL